MHNLAPTEQVSAPQMAQVQVFLAADYLLLGAVLNFKLSEQLLPVLLLHSVVSQVVQYLIELLVHLDVLHVDFVDLVAPHAVGEVAQLVLLRV